MSQYPNDPVEKPTTWHAREEDPAVEPRDGVTPDSDSPHGSRSEAGTGGSPVGPNPEGAARSEHGGTANAPAPFRRGSILRGRVVEVTPEQVMLALPDGLRGTVPLLEFAGHPTPREHDEVSVIVEKYDPATGELVISKRHADEQVFWQSVQPGDLLEGVVTGMNKGGLDVDLGGAKAFLPASQVDVRPVKDISVLIGQHVQCVVTQVDRTTKDLVVSRRKAIHHERKQKRQEVVAALVEGQVLQGKVSNLTDYGAFVDLDGADGLVHVTDLSWEHVRHPSEVLRNGQQVDVKVLKVDRTRGKVSLGIKQLTPDPWEGIESRYPAGSRVRAPAARLVDFGLFLELEKGVDALLPLSEMSWSHRIRHPSEVVQPGEMIEAVVLAVEPEKRRISVSRKQLEPDPWSTVEQNYHVDDTVKGKVAKIADFGAFVELAPGLEGLVHISELSRNRVNSVADVVQEGQEVEVRVLKIDPAGQRISLSMRPAAPSPRAERGTPAHRGSDSPRRGADSKKRKRPLRGGLSSHFEW